MDGQWAWLASNQADRMAVYGQRYGVMFDTWTCISRHSIVVVMVVVAVQGTVDVCQIS